MEEVHLTLEEYQQEIRRVKNSLNDSETLQWVGTPWSTYGCGVPEFKVVRKIEVNSIHYEVTAGIPIAPRGSGVKVPARDLARYVREKLDAEETYKGAEKFSWREW